MHILVKHVPEFLKCYGNLITFTQQGLEKLNNQITIDFARNKSQLQKTRRIKTTDVKEK